MPIVSYSLSKFLIHDLDGYQKNQQSHPQVFWLILCQELHQTSQMFAYMVKKEVRQSNQNALSLVGTLLIGLSFFQETY